MCDHVSRMATHDSAVSSGDAADTPRVDDRNPSSPGPPVISIPHDRAQSARRLLLQMAVSGTDTVRPPTSPHAFRPGNRLDQGTASGTTGPPADEPLALRGDEMHRRSSGGLCDQDAQLRRIASL
jgi:hypothetical protein